MKMLNSADLFAWPKRAHKTKEWFERAKLVVAAASPLREGHKRSPAEAGPLTRREMRIVGSPETATRVLGFPEPQAHDYGRQGDACQHSEDSEIVGPYFRRAAKDIERVRLGNCRRTGSPSLC